MKNRYRAAIYVDMWYESKEEAAKELYRLIKSIPNSFTDGVSEMPHGSEVSLVTEKEQVGS